MFVFAVNMSVCVVGGFFLLHKVVTPPPRFPPTRPQQLRIPPPLHTTQTQTRSRGRKSHASAEAIFVGSFLMATDVVIAN